jgi:hypothetical protein
MGSAVAAVRGDAFMFGKPARPGKKVPLKQRPLPQPGDSTYEAYDALLDGPILGWSVAMGLTIVFATHEWLVWCFSSPPHPVFGSVLTAIVVAIGLVKIRSAFRQLDNLRLGAAGERSVGQRLEEFRAKGYRVFHDIPQKGYNIDHVLIGSGGVFVIETKTISKPGAGTPTVVYDGQRVLVDGHEPDRDPLAQARAGRDRIGEILERATNRRPKLRAVVLYPDWYVERQVRSPEVWVDNPKALMKYLDHEPVALSPEDVALFASALETHVRAAGSA